MQLNKQPNPDATAPAVISLSGKGSSQVHCPRCGGKAWVPDFDESTKLSLGTLARSTPLSGIVNVLHRDAGMSLRDAKFIALHTTRTKGVCHRCSYRLVATESECPHCKALNLDW